MCIIIFCNLANLGSGLLQTCSGILQAVPVLTDLASSFWRGCHFSFHIHGMIMSYFLQISNSRISFHKLGMESHIHVPS